MHKAPYTLLTASALPGYALNVAFLDGTTGRVEMAPLLTRTDAIGVFEALRDPAAFARVAVVMGAVTWPEFDIDLAPDAMHRELKEHGVWVLR
ncbi:MAG: DUF2442 domain-containing protein [Holosporales bacterium]